MTPVQERMGRRIVESEARLDANGNIRVYRLGDGTFEIAGINSRYHSKEAHELLRLVNTGRFEEAKYRAIKYILGYTDDVVAWIPEDDGLEYTMRDTAFNRGLAGAAKILQMAADVKADGDIGPITRSAVAQIPVLDLIERIRWARERYEIQKYGRRRSWAGMVRRWSDAREFAIQLSGKDVT